VKSEFYFKAKEIPLHLKEQSEMITANCKNYMWNINTLCGQNAEFWIIQAADTYGETTLLQRLVFIANVIFFLSLPDIKKFILSTEVW